jgi:hypothetical protein
LETAAKLLRSLERLLADFSKCALKSLDNQADFDSAIPRFESWRPSQQVTVFADFLCLCEMPPTREFAVRRLVFV